MVSERPVLATGSLGDFVLTLAEEPALFLPQWSEKILREVRRTQFEKLGWPEHLADFWQKQCRECFPEAMVADYSDRLSMPEIISSQAANIAPFRLRATSASVTISALGTACERI